MFSLSMSLIAVELKLEVLLITVFETLSDYFLLLMILHRQDCDLR